MHKINLCRHPPLKALPDYPSPSPFIILILAICLRRPSFSTDNTLKENSEILLLAHKIKIPDKD
jgi:hypothetical protein